MYHLEAEKETAASSSELIIHLLIPGDTFDGLIEHFSSVGQK